MKKTYKLTPENPQANREIESIKKEVRKYLNRERKKALPKGTNFWDFDCKFGADESTSKEFHVSEINNIIDKVQADGLESFYLEILAKAVTRTKKPAELKELEQEEYFDDEFDEELDEDFQ
ncbi:DUF6172 family protein [Thiomicrorhabdus sp. Milos-T2]|uniref:DUF6172 family protein n=1 Tax=Thiomicrorhabdus sp. Milos-T2 TaxID=90814 RepID=UPI0004947D50|nr:DUF6172 family protein [Thiomicrorhabdus sp. Milos-T2]